MIGKLDRRVSFIQPIISNGVSNEDKITGWELITSVPEVWAQKQETTGSTIVQSDRVMYSQTVNWVIRYRTDLLVSMRLVDSSGQVYEILGTAEIEDNRKRYTRVTTGILDNEYYT